MARRVVGGIVLVCAVALVLTAAVAIGGDGIPVIGDSGGDGAVSGDRSGLVAYTSGGASDSGGDVDSGPDGNPPLVWVSAEKRVDRGEALPCTGPKDPTNFEVYSAGPAVGSLPLTGFKRRCGGTTPVDEPPANLTNYIYGDCEPAEGGSSCVPPLEIQTWPACQRTLADYSFEGKPIPHRDLPKIGEAKVVVIEFMFEPRIEVYTATSTIVIFTENADLAEEALAGLRPQDVGEPPATQADELAVKPERQLAAPNKKALEGELKCQS